MVDMEMRTRRIQEFEDTLRVCEREQDLVDRIATSRECLVLWRNISEIGKENGYTEQDLLGTKRYRIPCKVLCWNQCDLDLISLLKKENNSVCIGTLLISAFACFGGNVLRGVDGEVERFCRCTTLYPCLEAMNQQSLYYQSYPDGEDETCVYVHDVICLRRGRKDCERMERQDWFSSDVIIYTSENLRRLISMIGQECSIDMLQGIQQEYEKEQYRSLDVMLQMAAQQGLEELVIPISQYVWDGCELRRMIEGMRTALQKYTYFFRAVHFVFV